MANNSNLRNEINLYFQDLLKLQYKASSGISHKVTKGDLREAFIKKIVTEKFPKLIIGKGIITKDTFQSSEADFICLNSQQDSMKIYDLDDCNFFMEIKSKANKSEFDKLDVTALKIKNECHKKKDIPVGMFCYSTCMKEQTLLYKFGFKYDKDIQAYDNYNEKFDVYKNIDFVFSLNICEDEENQPYIIVRDIQKIPTLFVDNPVIKYLFNYFN